MRRYRTKNKKDMDWAYSLLDTLKAKSMNPNIKHKLKVAEKE